MHTILKKVPVMVAVGLITFYKAAISPLLPSSCRFVPSCSEYGLIAFQRFGFRRGFVLTAKRICRCRPGGPHGYDPVPDIPENMKGSAGHVGYV
nr:membrane protein insertion efficiency factor YidD [Adlercreutzia murintestinalis]